MTVTDKLKIIDNKIKANQAQYDLDKLAAKISALSSGELRTYEYQTDEDLGYQPSVLEQKKIDYSPLGIIFTKELDKEDKEEGLLKRLKNIENARKKLDNSEYVKDEDEDKDENKKNECDLYQGSIEGMECLKLPAEIESKDEKSQMYLKNNLNKNNFLDIYDKYQRFSEHIADEEKKVLATKHFHLKLKVLIFLINMVLYMSI